MKTNQIVYLVVLIIIGGGLFAYYGQNKTNNQSQNNPSANKVNPPITEVKDSPVEETPKTSLNDLTGDIIALKSNNGNKEIISISIKDGSEKLIYSDKSQDNKIIYTVGLKGNNVIFLEGSLNNADHGNLVELTLNDISKKVTLQKDLSPNINPIIQPQSNKLLITSFSQVERDFGYSLILEDLDGKNQKTIVSKIPSIHEPTFSPDGKLIYYEVEDGKSRTIQEMDITGKMKNKTLFSSVLDLLKTDNQLLALANSPKEERKSQLTIFNSKLEKTSELSIDNSMGTNIFKINDSIIGYAGTLSPDKKSTLNILDINTKENKKIGDYDNVIGYINE